jgi:hypothetical protein
MLPAPAMLMARNGALGLMYFFVSCMGLVADVFWCDFDAQSGWAKPEAWTVKLTAALVWLLAAWLVFAAMCLPLDLPHGAVAAVLGLLELIPSLCIVPWMIAVTRNPFFATVFSLVLVTCMKLLGCIVVVAVHGWDASEHGHTAMPWTRPNLLVWAFLIFTGILSVAGLRFGAAHFRSRNTSAMTVPGD